MELLLPILLIAVYLFLFYLCGVILCHGLGRKESIPFKIVYGYFLYFLLFFAVTIIPKALKASLTFLSVLWVIVVCLILIFGIRFLISERETINAGKGYIGITLLLIFLMTALLNTNGDYITIWDAAYYIGDVNTSVYTDSISAYDPYTGAKLSSFTPDYFLEVLQNHSAVVCRLFHIPALLEVRTTLFSVNIILFYTIIVLFSGMFFEDREKQRTLFLVLFMFFDLFTYNLHTRSQILLMRGYEGKAVAANIIIFGLLYILFRYIEGEDDIWKVGVLVSMASFGLNMTSILLVPALTAAVLIPHMIVTAKYDRLRYAIYIVLPMVFPGVMYLGMKYLR